MYQLDLIKIKANEEFIENNIKTTLYDSFFIVRLYEDDESIIGIVKNQLCWDMYNLNSFEGNRYMGGESELVPFNYGDCIIYNKETKKIIIYDYEEE
jgi:hypothetical protein